MKNRSTGRLSGFTLIELLVVVLIIGILSAIALPQYQKAVQKSRNAQLKTAVRAVWQAAKAYRWANGENPKSFDGLDIDFPLSAPTTADGASTNNICGLVTAGPNAIRQGNGFQVVLNCNASLSCSAVAVWIDGPYKCSGFSLSNSSSQWYCIEARGTLSDNLNGKFCKEVEQGTFDGNRTGWAHYRLP